MAKILLVQPDWPVLSKTKDVTKYWPWPLLKIGGMLRQQGHEIALAIGNEVKNIAFVPDHIYFTTVFSYYFDYVKECIESYRFLYPNAAINIGGVHCSIAPDLYRYHFPYAHIHVGILPEAEQAEPAFDLIPTMNTQIISYSRGCFRKSCTFCYCHLDGYEEFPWEHVSKKIRFNKLILNDYNFANNSNAVGILKHLANLKVNGRPISSVEIQGGLDPRIISKRLDLIPLLKEARVKNIRLSWDRGMEMREMLETCIEKLYKHGYHSRDIRIYSLYNWDIPYETILEKIPYFESWKVGPIASRFRPITILHDGYVKQKRSQAPFEYYIHEGWTDKKIRTIGSLYSDLGKLSRSPASSLNEVREYYGKPTVEQTLEAVEESEFAMTD